MESNGEKCGLSDRRPKLAPLVSRSVSWTDNGDDIEVPGTPKTPRTSTTPGNATVQHLHLINNTICFLTKFYLSNVLFSLLFTLNNTVCFKQNSTLATHYFIYYLTKAGQV